MSDDADNVSLGPTFRGQSVPRSDECVLSNEFIDEAIRRYAPCFQFARYIEREVLRQVQTTATLKLEDAERTIADLRIRHEEAKEKLSNARAENARLLGRIDDLVAGAPPLKGLTLQVDPSVGRGCILVYQDGKRVWKFENLGIVLTFERSGLRIHRADQHGDFELGWIPLP